MELLSWHYIHYKQFGAEDNYDWGDRNYQHYDTMKDSQYNDVNIWKMRIVKTQHGTNPWKWYLFEEIFQLEPLDLTFIDNCSDLWQIDFRQFYSLEGVPIVLQPPSQYISRQVHNSTPCSPFGRFSVTKPFRTNSKIHSHNATIKCDLWTTSATNCDYVPLLDSNLWPSIKRPINTSKHEPPAGRREN